MGINKYNSEGYYDPTVYEALSNIEKEEKAARRVYRRSEERRGGKECRSRWSPYH